MGKRTKLKAIVRHIYVSKRNQIAFKKEGYHELKTKKNTYQTNLLKRMG